MSSIIDPSSVPSPPGEPAWQVALLFPDQGAWSEDDYLALDSGRLVEFEDGCIEVLPMPTLLHQLIVDFLHTALKAFVVEHGLGMAFFAPVPVRLRPGKYLEPENRARDWERKRKDYAKAGIAEYWIVDPELQRIGPHVAGTRLCSPRRVCPGRDCYLPATAGVFRRGPSRADTATKAA